MISDTGNGILLLVGVMFAAPLVFVVLALRDHMPDLLFAAGAVVAFASAATLAWSHGRMLVLRLGLIGGSIAALLLLSSVLGYHTPG